MRDTGAGTGDETLETSLGLDGYVREAEDMARMRLTVTDRVRQPFGIVHGGAFASLAESLCSRATYEAVGPENGAFGQVNDTAFLRPVSSGVVEGVARARHRGRTSWVWDVEMSDEEGRLCAITRMVIAIRPIERPAPDAA